MALSRLSAGFGSAYTRGYPMYSPQAGKPGFDNYESRIITLGAAEKGSEHHFAVKHLPAKTGLGRVAES